jgi:enterochelin esterase family protein
MLVAGMSMGGRAAVFTGLRRPDVFGNVIAQSTAVSESGPGAIDALTLPGSARTSERLAFYLDVGLLEMDSEGDRDFLPGSRRLRDRLRATGHYVHYAELPCGHDEIVSGESIADGLRLLLGGFQEA